MALSQDGPRGVVTHWYGYDLAILDVEADRLEVVGRVEVGPEPRGVAISADGPTAYVAVGVSNEVVRVDLDARQVTGRLTVGREPRGLALTPDGVAAARRQRPVAEPLGDRDRRRGRSSGRCRSRATTSGRSPSAPTAGRATSPT